MLEIRNVSIGYGSLQAVWDVSLEVQDKELVTIVGSNGAGKSTIMKAISGLIEIWDGSILFEGKRLDGLLPNKIVTYGIAQVPEGRHLFPEMTVYENLIMGGYQKSIRSLKEDSLSTVYRYFPKLSEMRNRVAGTLSGGEQQMLAIGRGLMARPKLLILDEPSLGLAPKIVAELFDIIQKVNQTGVTILLVEQNVRYSLKIADRGYILESGKLVMSGSGEELLNNEEIKKSYLGGKSLTK